MAQRGTLAKSFLAFGLRDSELIEDRSAEGIFYSALPDSTTALTHLGWAYLQPQTHVDVNLGFVGTGSFDSWGGAQLAAVPIAVADQGMGEAISAQPQNHRMTNQAIPNDARYTDGSLWGMYGDSSSPANQFGSQAAEAWEQGHTGSMANVIGVIDTGIDYTHPDLYLNIWLNQREIPTTLRASLSDIDSDGLITFRDLNGSANASYVLDYNSNGRIDAGDLLNDARWENGVDEDGNGYRDDLIGWDFVNNDNDPMDDNRHGTHVAGTIGALGGNAIGVAGVNWNVQIVAVKYLNASNSGLTSNAVKAVNYFTDAAIRATAAENFLAANNSWSGSSYNQALLDAVTHAAERDILFVTIAGNNAQNTDDWEVYPARYSTAPTTGHEAVISVASITSSGNLWSASNFGMTSVDLAAPGREIWSTLPNGEYGSLSGTSMAAPHVTGAIALYASLFPNATSAQIRQALLQSATFTASINDLVASDGRLNIPAMLAIAPPVTEFADWLDGSNNADNLSGLGGNDTLIGGEGADTLAGGLGTDSLLGGENDDLVSYAAATSPVTVNLLSNLVTGAAGNDTLSGIENAMTGTGADSLLGDSVSNQLLGGDGADTLNGGLGEDSLIGGAGNDLVSFAGATGAVTVSLASGRVSGALGNDSLWGFENILGGNGADSLLGDSAANQLIGGIGADTLDGSGGTDLVSYAGANGAVTVNLSGNLASGAAGNDSLFAIENALGGRFADSLLGDAASNFLAGGAGADTLNGGLGADSLVGDAGIDLVSYAGATGAVTVSLASGLASAASESDSLSGIENVLGGNDADSLLGNAASNQLMGGDGADTLDGGIGLYGGSHSDTLHGGDGNDFLIGSSGLVHLTFVAAQTNPLSFVSVGGRAKPIFADIDNDQDLDLVVGGYGGDIASFRRNSDGSFTPMNGVGWWDPNPRNPFWGIDVGSSSAPAFADLNGDGSQDLLIGNADGRLWLHGVLSRPIQNYLNIDVGDVSTPAFVDFDVDGDLDLVVGAWDGTFRAWRKDNNGYVGLFESESPFDGIDVGYRSSPSFVDLDFDGDLDLVSGAGEGQIVCFERSSSGRYVPMKSASGSLINPFERVTLGWNASAFTDLNGDGLPDLVAGGGTGAWGSEQDLLVYYGQLSNRDSLAGGNGADTLEGIDGAHTLNGGGGNDLYIISDTLDIIIETANGGADTIITSLSMAMPDHIEALRIADGVSGITITGGAGNDMLIGNGLSNSFNGGAGDDVILTGSATLADIYALFAT
jgi:subtilisin family serine protease